MYFKFKSPSGIDFILKKDNDQYMFIPIDNNNSEYVSYTVWLSENSEPEYWNPE